MIQYLNDTLGIEALIFIVTAVFALLINILKKPSKLASKLSKEREYLDVEKVSTSSPSATVPSGRCPRRVGKAEILADMNLAYEDGELELALRCFARLQSITTPSIQAYTTVLRIHAKRRDWQRTTETIQDMRSHGISLDAISLNVVSATGVAADCIEEVESLLVDSPLSDIVSYNTLIKGYAQRCNGDGAARALDQIRQRGLTPNAITFNSAMGAAVRSSQSDMAWSLLSAMRSSGLKPDKFTCSVLIKSLLMCDTDPNRIFDALSLLQEVNAAQGGATLLSSIYQMILQAAPLSEPPDYGRINADSVLKLLMFMAKQGPWGPLPKDRASAALAAITISTGMPAPDVLDEGGLLDIVIWQLDDHGLSDVGEAVRDMTDDRHYG